MNLRSLADTGFVELRPITLLLGRNSSGKSTFLRTFPLFRQTVDARTQGPFLWYGNYVDFGSFEEAVRTQAQPKIMTIEFRDRVSLADQLGYADPRVRPSEKSIELPLSVRLEIAQEQKDSPSYAQSVSVEVHGQRIDLRLEPQGKVKKLLINGEDVSTWGLSYDSYNVGRVIPMLYEAVQPTTGSESEPEYVVQLGVRGRSEMTLFNMLTPFFHGKTSRRTILSVLRQITFGSDEEILQTMRSINEGGRFWHDRVSRLGTNSPEFVNIRNLLLALLTPRLLNAIENKFGMFARGVRYIAPLRASTERYYRTQNLAVDEIDPEGRNLAVFLRSVSDKERRRFQEWTEEYFGLSIGTRSTGGHITLRVTEAKSNTEYNLADVGFGFSQILPIIAQVWYMLNTGRTSRRARRDIYNTIAIEQPELHLHPAMQAKVADLMASSVNVAGGRLKMIVETHSETIVNRIGHLISKGTLKTDNVSVLVFEPDSQNGTRIRRVEYDSQGYMRDWPFGFFLPDEE